MDEKKQDWRKYKEAANRARIKYAQTHEKQIKFSLHKERDADILDHLDRQPNKAGYFKQLIRDDIAKEKGEG